jgi:hypothetical protein
MSPGIFNRFLLKNGKKTISKFFDKITFSKKCLYILQGKEILHQTTSYQLVRREDKGEVKITRSTNQPWTYQQNVDMPDQQNNYENAKVICIDVSDVIKLLKYMQEFLAFSILII